MNQKLTSIQQAPVKPSCASCIHWKNERILPGTLQRMGECWEGPPTNMLVPLPSGEMSLQGLRLVSNPDFICHRFASRTTTADPLAELT